MKFNLLKKIARRILQDEIRFNPIPVEVNECWKGAQRVQAVYKVSAYEEDEARMVMGDKMTEDRWQMEVRNSYLQELSNHIKVKRKRTFDGLEYVIDSYVSFK